MYKVHWEVKERCLDTPALPAGAHDLLEDANDTIKKFAKPIASASGASAGRTICDNAVAAFQCTVAKTHLDPAHECSAALLPLSNIARPLRHGAKEVKFQENVAEETFGGHRDLRVEHARRSKRKSRRSVRMRAEANHRGMGGIRRSRVLRAIRREMCRSCGEVGGGKRRVGLIS